MPKAITEERICIDGKRWILLSGRPVGYIRDGAATVDAACQTLEVSRFLRPRCRSIRFVSGIAVALEQEDLTAKAVPVPRVRIYQLKPGTDPERKFISYDNLVERYGGINSACYIVVYDGEADSPDPETVYRLLRDTLSPGWNGHPLTRSDVLELYGQRESRFFYVDTYLLRPVVFEAREAIP